MNKEKQRLVKYCAIREKKKIENECWAWFKGLQEESLQDSTQGDHELAEEAKHGNK